MSERIDELNSNYVDLLKQHGVDLRGKKILDVGADIASFMALAKQRGAEVWGVDHMADAKAKAIKHNDENNSPLSAEDISHYLEMSFGQMLDKCPDLQGAFDVINCTGVSAYMDMKEMRNFSHVAHQLLKPGGTLLFELPWDINTQAYQAGQSAADMGPAFLARHLANLEAKMRLLEGNATPSEKIDHNRKERLVDKFRKMHKKLLQLHFADCSEHFVAGKPVPIIIAKQPREHIPPVNDIVVNFREGEVTFKGMAKHLWQQILQEERGQARPEEMLPEKPLSPLVTLLASSPKQKPGTISLDFGRRGKTND